jgi:glutathione synthase/RimK-type ligase-like ATP-grasp enzyme
MTVLILGGADDEHASVMLDHLRQHGHDGELLDSRWFPAEMGLTNDPVSGAWTIRLPGGRILHPGQVQSVYWRCYNSILTPALPDEEQAFIAGNDARSLFESFLMRFPARWVNGWDGYLMHQTKPAALALVASLGVPVPATMLGNDPQAVRDFAVKHPRCIFKPVQGGAHTRRVTPQHLTDDNLRNLKYAPVTLQEEVVGTNIRVFVAGTRVLACEVRSADLDFRDTADPEIIVHDLPPEIEARSRAVAKALALVWTGIDYRLTADGQYVFLEANPSPMFLGFESRCGLPLTESLTNLLTQP